MSLFLFLISSSGCSQHEDKPAPAGKIDTPVAPEVTAENYLSGKQFCQTYKDVTSKEHGKYVSVPYDYDLPEAGSLEIYVYSMAPFDPSKPSYIYVDGGPGQNSHDLMPEFLKGEFNELRFDQRGLGCSAPPTYELYRKADLYSTENTVLDMEEIRQSYGIKSWSIYGISYGTVPATMYASRYPKETTSVVIEGVVGDLKHIHSLDYKAEKMNLAIADLNPNQRRSFFLLMDEKSSDTEFLTALFFEHFYRDVGMNEMKAHLQKLISAEGKIDRDLIAKARKNKQAIEQKYPRPQQPGTVDENILNIIFCKNLDYRNKVAMSLYYNAETGFKTEPSSNETNRKFCDRKGVNEKAERPYKMEANPVTNPIYYFQGSHDGATLAIGALSHWRTVAKGHSYFMLAEKGGHNPNLHRLKQKKSVELQMTESLLFKMSLVGQDIKQIDLDRVNVSIEASQKWNLYRDPRDTKSGIEDKLKGIQIFAN